jgi:hypothetical protein
LYFTENGFRAVVYDAGIRIFKSADRDWLAAESLCDPRS